MTRFTKIADSDGLSVPVRYIPLKSYPAAVTAFKNDQIQLAWFGGLTAVQALRAVPNSQVLAQGKEDKAFISYFIANAARRAARASPSNRGCACPLAPPCSQLQGQAAAVFG